MPAWLALCDLGAPGRGEPWFPHGAVLLFLTCLSYGDFLFCCFASRHTNWWCISHDLFNCAGRVNFSRCRCGLFCACCVWFLVLFAFVSVFVFCFSFGIVRAYRTVYWSSNARLLLVHLLTKMAEFIIAELRDNMQHAVACWSTWRKLRGDGQKQSNLSGQVCCELPPLVCYPWFNFCPPRSPQEVSVWRVWWVASFSEFATHPKHAFSHSRFQKQFWESSRTSSCVALNKYLWTQLDFRSFFFALQLWHESMFNLIRRNLCADAVGVYAPLEPPLFDRIIKQWKKVRKIFIPRPRLNIIMFIVFILYSLRRVVL